VRELQKKVLYIDLDDTTADFYKSARNHIGIVDESRMYEKDFFFDLKPVDGALVAVRKLIRMGFDIWILTQPLADCFDSYTDKVKWVGLHFPELVNKIIMTQDKGLHSGHYLIDDNSEKWKEKFEKNGGKFVHFEYDRGKNKCHKAAWNKVVEYFKGAS